MSRALSLLSFCAGIFSVGFFPKLPNIAFLILPILLGTLLLRKQQVVLACLLWGISYGTLWGHYSLSHVLPDELTPIELTITGEITGLPAIEDKRSRFYFNVHHIDHSAVGDLKQLSPKQSLKQLSLQKLRLNWYSPSVIIEPGQVWQLRVKVRRPRGTVNPGGFDYQAWLLRQGVSATGYVRHSDQNKLLSTQVSFQNFLGVSRFYIREAILKQPLAKDVKALLTALTVGDRSLITTQFWDELAFAGVIHLMVISGLHIGLIAYFFYVIGSGFARCISIFGVFPINARYWGSVYSLLAALIYAALAGFSLPTQRALVMVVVAILALLLDRKISRGLGFCMALAGVAVIDPLAFLSAGFWLSFGAVACLLWLVPVYKRSVVSASYVATTASLNHNPAHHVINPAKRRWQIFPRLWLVRLKQFFSIQWLLFLALTIPLMIFQLPIAWLAPWVNLLAIPWISFVVVPLCLLGTALLPINEVLATQVWSLAGWQINYFIDFIRFVSAPDLSWGMTLPRYLPLPKTWAVCAALILLLVLLLLPRGVPGKYLMLPLLLMMVFVMQEPLILGKVSSVNSLKVSVLDVGQGLAVVVKTEGDSGKHTLLYDTGPGYDSGFNMADAVVIPYMRHWGETSLDRLIVSHRDNDHAGGTKNIIDALTPAELVFGEAIDMGGAFSFSTCQAGDGWHWDEVGFEFLHPNKNMETDSNNRSCVLKISYRGQTIILPGDIEMSVERQLIQGKAFGSEVANNPVTLLVAPHHGSKTSSSKALVQLLSPQHVVFSAGYKHHFRHPAKAVVERYQEVGSKIWSTANQGAIEFIWDDRGQLTVSNSRANALRYWY